MNSINDILNQKADELFISSTEDTTNNTFTSATEPLEIESVTVTEEPIDLENIKKTVYQIKDQLESLLRILNKNQTTPIGFEPKNSDTQTMTGGETILEGVFNGEKMVGPDGQEYAIPPNYASKSKLVEGDIMKLTITKNGSFIFKQIGPIAKKRLVGELVENGEGNWQVLADGKTYKILTASVTFYKGVSGDETVILVPVEGSSDWAAVENIIKK